MDFLGVLCGIAGVFLLACLSPGPVWVVITSTSVAVSRRAGVFTGLGVALATLTWATIAMLGVGLLVQLVWLTLTIKLAGAAYLAWLGVRMIAGARRPSPAAALLSAATHGGWTAVRRGYIASITNPKAAAFFSSIFVVMLPGHAPAWVFVAAILLLAALSALCFSVTPVQEGYRKAKSKIDALIGAILIGLGIRLVLSR